MNTTPTPKRDWLSLIATLAIIITFVGFFVLLLGGCNGSPLRFAPSEAQKQAAWQSHLIARTVDTAGAEADSPATNALVQGTQAALAYSGMPAEPTTEDIDATLAQANADATRRPTGADVIDAVDDGLGLGADLLLALGLGGTVIGGKKIADLIAAARQRAEALKEVILNNELFKAQAEAAGNEQALDLFKKAQLAQTQETKILVTATKAEAEKPIVVAAAPTAAPAATSS